MMCGKPHSQKQDRTRISSVHKVERGGGLLGYFGHQQYIVFYTNTTCLVWDDKLQVHKYPEQYIRVDAVDEMDAAIKGMDKLRSLYGANNVRLGGNKDELGGNGDSQEK
jgi:hypothetical protein